MSEQELTRGRRLVLLMYVVSVGIAGMFGYVLGVIVYGNNNQNGVLSNGPKPPMGQIGPITFPLTPINLTIFGIISVGLLLGLGLLAVRYASKKESRA